MLDKDQYNQESYNDYYNQATEDAEIKSHKYRKKSNKKLFFSLLFLLLGVIGYVAYMIFNSLSSHTTTPTTPSPKNEAPQTSLNQELINLPKSQQLESETEGIKPTSKSTQAKAESQKASLSTERDEKKVEKVEVVTVETNEKKVEKAEAVAVEADEKKVEKVEAVAVETNEKKVENVEKREELDETKKEIAKSIERAIPNATKMNPDEIAKIVTLVMKEVEKKQREQKQEPEVQSQSTTEEELNPSSDEALISLLEGSSTDTIQTIKESEEDTATSEAIKNREVKSEKKGENNYNKVFVSKKPKERLSNVDELTQLSREISNIIGNDELASIVSAPESRPDNYTKSIATEATVRSNEMRIIVVQKGDTLGKIALRAYGSAKAYKKIYRANPDLINRPDRIYIGQKLRIPK